MARISYLIGIYKALHILYGDTLADAWVKIPNQNRLFKGDTPIAYMASDGIVAMQYVRALLDARRIEVRKTDRFEFLWSGNKNPKISKVRGKK